MIFLLFFAEILCDSEEWISVNYENGNYSVFEGKNESCMVIAGYKGERNDTGWDKIDIYMNTEEYSEDAARCMGYAEGYFTSQSIQDLFLNVYDVYNKDLADNTTMDNVKKFMKDNHEYVNEYVKTIDSDYKKHASMIYAQYNGMFDGYSASYKGDDKLDSDFFYLMEGMADILDLLGKYGPKVENKTIFYDDEILKRSHCSAYVKLTKLKNELYMAHNSWFYYSSMLKSQKTYHYHAPTSDINVSMSSFPGIVSSDDDFFITSNKLGILETTLNIFNESLYDELSPRGLPSWLRTMTSVTLSKTSEDFVDNIQKELTGTYNDQYCVVNYNKFKEGKKLENNTVMICEVYPRSAKILDISPIINSDSYFGMYNVPYIEEVYEILGYKKRIEEEPKSEFFWGRTTCSRAKQFEALSHTILDLDTAKSAIRYNNYKVDDDTKNPSGDFRDPGAAVCSRYDLRDGTGGFNESALGGIDGKVVSSYLIDRMNFVTAAGLTTSHQLRLKTTSQLEKETGFPHRGLPEHIHWGWTQISWDNERVEGINTFNFVSCIVCGACIVTTLIVCVIIIAVCELKKKSKKEEITLGVTKSIAESEEANNKSDNYDETQPLLSNKK